MNLDWLTDEVLRRLRTQLPSALLLGELPEPDGRFFYVHEPPYEQVVIGLLLPDELLQMPTRPVCDALLQGLPVWIWPQPYRYGRHGLLLRQALQEAEDRLIRFGARPVGKELDDGRRDRDRKFLGYKKM